MIRLIHALQNIPALKDRGLEVAAYDFTAAVIHRDGHVRALWRKAGGVYEFVPAHASVPAYIACSLEELVTVTEFIFENQTGADAGHFDETRDPDEPAGPERIDWSKAKRRKAKRAPSKTPASPPAAKAKPKAARGPDRESPDAPTGGRTVGGRPRH